MEKQSKYPVYLVAYKNGNITKCKSANELNIYRKNNESQYFEINHYPSNEEIQNLLNSLKENNT